jgi:hypothetical protein
MHDRNEMPELPKIEPVQVFVHEALLREKRLQGQYD